MHTEMTQAKWDSLSPAERDAIRDYSDLSPQLIGLEGWRVSVIRGDGTSDRFIVGRSTGWKPCHLEIRRRSSHGGAAADRTYQAVEVIERVR